MGSDDEEIAVGGEEAQEAADAEEHDGSPPTLELQCGDDTVELRMTWDDVAKQQCETSPDDYVDTVPSMAARAMLFREALDLVDWTNKVFVVRCTDCVYIFDEYGDLLETVGGETPQGRCELAKFIPAWTAGYFKLGGVGGKEEHDENGGLAFAAEGKRVKLLMGTPGAWYGGLVVDIHDIEVGIAFDDGDLAYYEWADLHRLHAAQQFVAIEDDVGGVIANEAGHSMAARMTEWRPGGRSTWRAAGVLVGATTDRMGGDTIYQSHHIYNKAFEQKSARAKRAAKAKGAAAETKDAKETNGWFTFRKGDCAEYVWPDHQIEGQKRLQAYV